MFKVNELKTLIIIIISPGSLNTEINICIPIYLHYIFVTFNFMWMPKTANRAFVLYVLYVMKMTLKMNTT